MTNAARIPRGLAHLLAESFAVHTVEVLRLLREEEAHRSSSEEGRSQDGPQEGSPPEGVLEAQRRVKAGTEKPREVKDLRTRVARNALILALRDKGGTQAQLAKKLGKSPAAISRIFKNPERCRLPTIRKVADALGVNLKNILP